MSVALYHLLVCIFHCYYSDLYFEGNSSLSLHYVVFRVGIIQESYQYLLCPSGSNGRSHHY